MSLAVHIVVAFMLVAINPWRPHVVRPSLWTPRLASVVYLESVPVDLPALDLPKLSEPEIAVAPEPKPELPEPVPVTPIETAVAESPVAKPVPAITEPPRVVPPPPPPSPTVGLFPEATAATRTPVVTRQVEAAGFDTPVKQTVESKVGQATVGAFDTAPQNAQRQAATNGVVTESGFGRASAPSTSSRPTGTIRAAGFGSSTTPEKPKAAQPTTAVSAAGFDQAPAQTPQRAAAVPEAPKILPVEVRSKPTPVYTDKARELKIEGDVILEVEFLATGSLRVIRVVKGLGYGLDEAAMKAAEQIQFKPAQDGGRPVDFKTTVHIVFRLA
ncbi:MAG: TonB family protein [Cyanobacteria bacterium]|nr:TonB family protein [Cyanobacteriota bacterium]